jgi:WD40 repeat protein
VLALAFSPDGQVLASASGVRDPKLGEWVDKRNTSYYTGGEVRFWDLSDVRPPAVPPAGAGVPESQVPLQELSAHTSAITGLAYTHHDGRRLVTVSYDYKVKVWDVPAGPERLRQQKPSEIAGWQAHPAWVRGLAISPDDTRLATVAGGGKRGEADFGLRVWDLATGKLLSESQPPEKDKLTCVAYSPDGKELATGSDGREVKLWDAETCTLLHTFARLAGPVAAVAFSPDGTRLAAGCGDRTVRLWDVASREEVGCFRGHALGVESIAFTPDGRRLASGGLDRTVKVWDVNTGQETLSLPMDNAQAVSVVKFSPDGGRLAVGTGEPAYPATRGVVKVWDARPIPEQPGTGR